VLRDARRAAVGDVLDGTFATAAGNVRERSERGIEAGWLL
jgi:hypothetical protein